VEPATSTCSAPDVVVAVKRALIQFPPNMPTLVKDLWTKNTEIARTNGVALTPQHFAEMFVDNNLSGNMSVMALCDTCHSTG